MNLHAAASGNIPLKLEKYSFSFNGNLKLIQIDFGRFLLLIILVTCGIGLFDCKLKVSLLEYIFKQFFLILIHYNRHQLNNFQQSHKLSFLKLHKASIIVLGYLNPAGNYMFKVKNRKTPLAIGVILESLLLTLDIFRTCVSIVNFERVIAGWEDIVQKRSRWLLLSWVAGLLG